MASYLAEYRTSGGAQPLSLPAGYRSGGGAKHLDRQALNSAAGVYNI